jgi:cytoskeletal protein CcmA (bactofilin family)
MFSVDWGLFLTSILLIFLFALPFIPALFELYHPKDSEPLEINGEGTLSPDFSRDSLDTFGIRSFSSGEYTVVPGATFSSLKSPCIKVAEYHDICPIAPNRMPPEPYLPNDARWLEDQKFWYSRRSITIPPGVLVAGDLVSEQDIIIGEQAVISGTVRAGASIVFRALSQAEGNCIAENISLFYAAAVKGCIVASGHIRMMELSRAGIMDSPVSVVASDIVLLPGVQICGSIYAHKYVKVIKAEEDNSE